MIRINNKPYITTLICAGVILSWVMVAINSGQALFQTQHSYLLLKYGAIDIHMLEQGYYWRLFTSQFVHVVFLHMLLNVFFIYLFGAYIERQFSSLVFILVYFVGGVAGLYASVFFNPNAVGSGASQAICSLVGFLSISFLRIWHTARKTGVYILLFFCIQCSLDMYFAGHLKEGHLFGFAFGILLGLCVVDYQMRWKK